MHAVLSGLAFQVHVQPLPSSSVLYVHKAADILL